MSSTQPSIVKASKNLDEMRDIAARICRDYLTGAWKVISADDIQLKRISGGLSNFLYYVSLPDNLENNNKQQQQRTNVKRLRKDAAAFSQQHLSTEPKEVLLRIYGQMHGEQAMETVLTDTVVFTLLSERKLGPKLHGIFPGGRIEQYIPARPLTTHELAEPRISAKIAEKMAAIHSLNIPVSKEPEWLWKTMERWLLSSETVLATFESADANETRLCADMRTFDFRAELDWLKRTIEAEDYAVVFSHNDLQEGNILFREDGAGAMMDDGGTAAAAGTTMVTTMQPDTGCGNSNHSCNSNNSNSSSSIHMERIQYARQPSQNGLHDFSVVSCRPVTSTLTACAGGGPIDEYACANRVDLDQLPCDNATAAAAAAAVSDVVAATRSKRAFSLNVDDDIDADNTRDSVLSSDGSQTFAEERAYADDPALMIIDFEYCAYNYRGFDLANHFVEWTMDYTNKVFPFYSHRIEQYPCREQQEHFVAAYLKAMAAASGTDSSYHGREAAASAKEIGELLDEVRCFRMASHLFWSLWAIVNVHQEIEFGYWDYGMCRLKEYLSAKEEFTKVKGLSLKRKHTLDKRQ